MVNVNMETGYKKTVRSSEQGKRYSNIIFLILIIVYLLLLVLFASFYKTYPLNPSAYPIRLESRFLVQGDTYTWYSPHSNLLNNVTGLLSARKQDEYNHQLLQFNEQGNIIGHHHRVGGYDQDTPVALDFDLDGIDEYLVFRKDPNDPESTLICLYKRDQTITVIDTLTVRSTDAERSLILSLGASECSAVGDDSTVYISYLCGGELYRYRYFSVYSRGARPHLKKRFRTPLPIQSIAIAQTSLEHSDAFITGPSVCNGVFGYEMCEKDFPDSSNDCQSIVTKVTNRGNIIWSKVLAEGGGITQVTANESGDTAYAIFSHKNFTENRETLQLYRLSGDSGDLISSEQVPGTFDFIPSRISESKQAGLIYVRQDLPTPRLVALTPTGRKLGEYKLPAEIGSASQTCWLVLPDGNLGIAFIADGPSIVVLDTESGKYICRQPLENTAILKVASFQANGHGMQDRLVARNATGHQLLTPEPNHFPRWFIQRYKWLLLVILIPPALLLALYYGLRYLKLRRDSRRELESYVEQLRTLSASLRFAQEEERKRVALDIHDQLGQIVATMRWKLERTEGVSEQDRGELRDQVEALHDEIHRISGNLRPPLLDDVGLLAAIEWELESFGKRFGIQTEFTATSQEKPQNPELTIELFRVIQEGLTNIAKHSQACRVSLDYDVTDSHIDIQLTNDGVNTDSHHNDKQYTSQGIIGMKERLRPFGGKVELNTHHLGLNTLAVKIPLPE